MQWNDLPLGAVTCHCIESDDPCWLVQINPDGGAVRDIVNVLVYAVVPDLVACPRPAQTPRLLVLPQAAGTSIGPATGSFIGSADDHPAAELHLPVGPHVPDSFLAHHLWTGQIKVDDLTLKASLTESVNPCECVWGQTYLWGILVSLGSVQDGADLLSPAAHSGAAV